MNPHYITKNTECSFCGAKFNEIVYFRQNSISCPGCGFRMHSPTTAKRVDDYSKAITNIEKLTTDIVKVPNEHVITGTPGNIKVTDIVLAPTAMERTIQIANQEVIPFQTSKADKMNAISTLNQIASEKNKSLALIAQKEILANFSDDCIILLREYFFVGDKFFSATKYMNMRLSEVVKDPRFIGNTSRKSMLLAEMKYACEQLCGNAEIRSVTEVK